MRDKPPPEGPEVRICSDFINQKSKNKTFTSIFDVQKGNIPFELDTIKNFEIKSHSNGKELILELYNLSDYISVYVFMGMSGNWKYLPISECDSIKYTRLRLNDNTNNSLILYGGYMGPKYSIGKPFSSTKRGPDPTKQYEEFKKNILNNLDKKLFDKPICEALLNQEYFSGVGNYIRSTILKYADINPFISARESIQNSDILSLCRDIQITSYELNGGQLKDWKNPFDGNSDKFKEWVFYKKGNKIKDSMGRTFWYDPKWEKYAN